MNNEMTNYIESLNPKEKQAYEIAKELLGSLFRLENTNGYIEWKRKQGVTNALPSSS